MLEQAAVTLFVLAIGLFAWWLERSSKPVLAAALIMSAALVLLLDDYLAGPIPGSWGLTGAAGAGWGLRMLWEARARGERA